MNDKGHLLPGASRAGLPTTLQVKPHEGFTPEAIKPHSSREYVAGEGPKAVFTAEPPDWTKQAKCVGMWELFDEPTAAQFHKIVKPICDSCPVKDLCLQSALEEETEDGRPVGPQFRAGVRGGLRPRERVRVAIGAPKGRCEQGHDYAETGAYLRCDGVRWKCAECNRVQKRARRARLRELGIPDPDKRPVACGECGKTISANSMTRHLREVHGVEREKAA